MGKIKQALKFALSILFRAKSGSKSHIISLKGYQSLFFGYYDITPFSADDRSIVFHGQVTKSSECVDILVYYLDTKEYKKLGSTRAWNYQQGARLTWYKEGHIIYNMYDSERLTYYSAIQDVVSGSIVKKIDHPVQALYKEEFIISLNFWYLNNIGTEYGYKYHDNTHSQDALFYYDLKKEQLKALFRISDCQVLLKKRYGKMVSSHFNHFMISPDGMYFIFIYRFYCGNVRKDHLFGYSLEMDELELLIEDELVSHCNWRNNYQFIFWGIISHVRGYYMFNLKSKTIELAFGTKEDGHPTFLNENIVLTDTYPDRFLSQTLYTLNIVTKETEILHEQKHWAFYSAESRCDLHPSVSPCNRKYQIDVYDGRKRKVLVGDL